MNAPRQWYLKVRKDLVASDGYETKTEPCLFTLYSKKLNPDGSKRLVGMLLVHVDDFQISGDLRDPTFKAAYHRLENLYTW